MQSWWSRSTADQESHKNLNRSLVLPAYISINCLSPLHPAFFSLELFYLLSVAFFSVFFYSSFFFCPLCFWGLFFMLLLAFCNALWIREVLKNIYIFIYFTCFFNFFFYIFFLPCLYIIITGFLASLCLFLCCLFSFKFPPRSDHKEHNRSFFFFLKQFSYLKAN